MRFQIILITLTAALLPSGLAVAQPAQTPSSRTGSHLSPSTWHLGIPEADYLNALFDMDVAMDPKFNLDNDYTPDVRIVDAIGPNGEWTQGKGFVSWSAHGNTQHVAMEEYKWDDVGIGEGKRDSAFAYYLLDDRFAGRVSITNKENVAYYVTIFYSGLQTEDTSTSDALVVSGSCWGSSFTGLSGQRCFIAEDADHALGDDFDALAANLRGDNGSEKRTVTEAVGDCAHFRLVSGDGNTTVCPAVSDCSHTYGDQVSESWEDFWWDFDTFVDTNQPAHLALTSEGVIEIASQHWDGNRLRGQVRATGVGEGKVWSNRSHVVSANCPDLPLQHNWYVEVHKDSPPAAYVNGFGVVDGMASWDAIPRNTLQFRIQQGETAHGPWTDLIDVPLTEDGHYEVAVGGGSHYRLVEDELDGGELFHGNSTNRPWEATTEYMLPDEEVLRQSIGATRSAWDQGGGPAECVVEGGIVIYTTDELYDAHEWGVGGLAEYLGNQVNMVNVDDWGIGDPVSLAFAMRDDMEAWWDASGVTMFLLGGSASDWRIFDGPDWEQWWPEGPWRSWRDDLINFWGYEGEPWRDLLPAPFFADPRYHETGVTWYTPYHAWDQWYVDFDQDWIPDATVARLPFTTPAQVYALVDHCQYGLDGPRVVERVLFMVGNRDFMDPGDGRYALDVAEEVAAALPGGVDVEFLLETDWPDDADRNDATADVFNGWRPDLIVLVGSASNRSYPAKMYDQTLPVGGWTMDMLDPHGTHCPDVVHLSCDGGQVRTFHPGYEEGVPTRFLACQWGAKSWVAPDVGSMQRGNREFGLAYVPRLVEDPDTPRGTHYLAALREVLTEYSHDENLCESVRSIAFEGLPFMPACGYTYVTDAPAHAAPPAVFNLAQNTPNPFNPVTVIRYGVDVKGPVSLRIYDVSGRLVQTLADGLVEPGWYRTRWWGRNDAGASVASGRYYSRLVSGGRTANRTMVLLR